MIKLFLEFVYHFLKGFFFFFYEFFSFHLCRKIQSTILLLHFVELFLMFFHNFFYFHFMILFNLLHLMFKCLQFLHFFFIVFLILRTQSQSLTLVQFFIALFPVNLLNCHFTSWAFRLPRIPEDEKSANSKYNPIIIH